MVKENLLLKVWILIIKEALKMGSFMAIIVYIKRKIIIIMGRLKMGKKKGLESWLKNFINIQV